MSPYAISRRGNECVETFIALLSAIWDQRQTVLHSAIKISVWFLWTVVSYFCLPSTHQFSPFLVRAITGDRSGSADTWIMFRDSEGVGFVLWWVLLKCYKEKTYRLRHHGTDIRIRLLTHIHLNTQSDRHTESDMTLLTQTAYSEVTIQTADLQYL